MSRLPTPSREAAGGWCAAWQLHVGSFTPEGTFAAAAERLEHVAGLNFTAVQLMPICEHSDAWGYNPRQLMAVHGAYGTPDDLRALIRRAHELGLAVIIDVVCALLPSSHGYRHCYDVPLE